MKYGTEEGPSSVPYFTPSVQRVAAAGRKPQNRPLSKLNAGTFALRNAAGNKQIDNVLYVKNTQYMSFEGFFTSKCF